MAAFCLLPATRGLGRWFHRRAIVLWIPLVNPKATSLQWAWRGPTRFKGVFMSASPILLPPRNILLHLTFNEQYKLSLQPTSLGATSLGGHVARAHVPRGHVPRTHVLRGPRPSGPCPSGPRPSGSSGRFVRTETPCVVNASPPTVNLLTAVRIKGEKRFSASPRLQVPGFVHIQWLRAGAPAPVRTLVQPRPKASAWSPDVTCCLPVLTMGWGSPRSVLPSVVARVDELPQRVPPAEQALHK